MIVGFTRPKFPHEEFRTLCLTKKFTFIGTSTVLAARTREGLNKHKGCVVWFTGLVRLWQKHDQQPS